MRMEKFIAFVLVVLGLAVLSGCAPYPISEDVRHQAKHLTLKQVKANPEATRGAVVIWGGRILSTRNTPNGGEIYVFELPLGRREKPYGDNTASTGRFIALSPEYLDPTTYQRGRLITVAGPLQGVRNERLQNNLYRYPVLKIQEIHIWVRPRDYPLWWDGGESWYYPGGLDGYHGQQYRPGE